jgi:hypothetical protein
LQIQIIKSVGISEKNGTGRDLPDLADPHWAGPFLARACAGGEIQIDGEWATDVSGGKPQKGTGRHRPFDQVKIDGPRLSSAAGLGFPNPNVGRKNGEGSPRAHQR